MIKRVACGVALCLGLSLGGCSNTFFYNQLDWLIPWYVDDYVDLTRDQSRDLKRRLQPLLQWHREQELRQYLLLVNSVEQDLNETLTTAIIERWMNMIWVAYGRMERQVLPMLFNMGDDLTDRQMQKFIENLYRKQDELDDKYLLRSRQQYIEDSEDSFRDNFKNLIGRLTEQQKQRVGNGAAQLERFDDAWLDDRRRWIDTLAAILAKREEGWQQQVDTALAKRVSHRREAYRKAYSRNQQVIFETVADVLNSRSSKQSVRLAHEIADVKTMLSQLIGDASPI